MSRKSKAASRGPSQRQLRVGEEVRHVLAGILQRQDYYIEELDGLSITVSEVSVSPDLANARVYVMPLAGQDAEIVLPKLNQLAPVIGHQLAQKVHLRRIPRLKFVLDHSFDTADRMGRLFLSIESSQSDKSSEQSDIVGNISSDGDE